MRILVDAGNTSTKWQLRSGGEVVADGQGDLRALRDWVAALDDSKQYAVAVSCVKDDTYAHEIRHAFESLSERYASLREKFSHICRCSQCV